MRNEKGFTLIELVVVIVILGILAAVAAPKFTNMQVEARVAAMKGLHGSVQAATSLVHSKALVANQIGTTGIVTMEGGQQVHLAYGYPNHFNNGIPAALNMDGFIFTYENPADGERRGKFTKHGSPSACAVYYYPALGSSRPAPRIENDATVENCQ